MKKHFFLSLLGIEAGLLAFAAPAVYLNVSPDNFILFKRSLSEIIICLICLTLAAGLAAEKIDLRLSFGHCVIGAIAILGLVSLIGRPDEYNGLYAVVQVADWLAAAAAGYILLRSRGAVLGLARWASAGLLVTGAFGLYEHFTGISPFIDATGWGGRISSTFGAPTLYAGYLLAAYAFPRLGVKLSSGRGEKTFHAVALAVCIANIYCTGTITAFAGSVAVELFIFMGNHLRSISRKPLAAVAVIVVLLSLGFFAARSGGGGFPGEKSASLEMRLEKWSLAADMLRANPLRGVGIGHYGIYLPVYMNKTAVVRPVDQASRPENIFALTGAELGIPGLLAVAALFGAILFSSPKPAETGEDDYRLPASLFLRAGALGVMVYACFHFPLHTPGVWQMFFLAAGGAWAAAAPAKECRPGKLRVPGYMAAGVAGLFIACFSTTFMLKEINLAMAWKAIGNTDLNKAETHIGKAQTLSLLHDWKTHIVAGVSSERLIQGGGYAGHHYTMAAEQNPWLLFEVMAYITRNYNKGFHRPDMKSVEKIKQTFPDLPVTYLATADYFSVIGLHDEAVKDYAKYISMLDSPAWEQYYSLYIRMRNSEERNEAEEIRVLRESVALQPDKPQPYEYLGYALLGSGDMEGAIDMYRRAAEAAPENSKYMQILYQLKRVKKDAAQRLP